MGRIRVVLDTQIFIVGAFHEESGLDSDYIRIIRLGRDKRFELVMSSELLEQVNRVAKRIRNKDLAGFLQYHLWSDFDIDFVSDGICSELKKKYVGDVPKKDLGIFVTAIGGKAGYLVSENRKFLKKASKKGTFRCIKADEFVRELDKS